MTMDGAKRKAVIYCRVSDKKQKTEGDGLNSQEHRCRQYAAARGYVVEAVFRDDITGGGDFMNRPRMVEMLRFLDKSREEYVVIFDDLKRFARDTVFHWTLRRRLAAHNATVECLNFKFEDTPEGQFVETIVAAQGELERLQNRRQVIQKMKSRLERGYFVFHAPVGYRYAKIEPHGKILVPNEPLASIVREALEGYAAGRFQMQAEVKRFLESHPEFPRCERGDVRATKVTFMLKNPTYAGYIEAPHWDITLRKGQHEPLISFETYQTIQDRLNGRALVPRRADISRDFPLRGGVVCGHCATPLTACWSKGRNTVYPYYLCVNRGCESYGKSIRRDVLEGAFTELVRGLQPSVQLFTVASAMFRDIWNHRLASVETRNKTLKGELAKVEKQMEQFLDRIADTNIPSVITAYENRIRKLEEQKIVLTEKLASDSRPLKSFDESLRTALAFLANPWKLWESERLEHKRTMLKLAFSERLAYVRNEGFRTVNLALPFKALAGFAGDESKMVGRVGLEPTTKRLRVSCSTN